MKNITNGEFDLDIDADDRVNENHKFMRVPGGDAFDQLRRVNPNIDTTYHIESTGEYIEISGQAPFRRYPRSTRWSRR